jgi:SRSO17 transposase
MGDLAELDEYLDYLCANLGHADREISLKDYCRGLMLPI